jgi:hypothetical protein
MEITIDKQNLTPRIKKTGVLVYSELTNTLFIKSKNKGVMQIGSSSSSGDFVEKSTTIDINGVVQDLSTSRTWTIFVPTKTSELTNDSGFITTADLSSYLTITSAAATYQPILVSGTNIKTINGAPVLGSGNITIPGAPVLPTGSIPFSDGSTLIDNNSNLFWDNTNKRLGIGTNTPTAQVHIKGVSGISNRLLLESPDANPIIKIHTWSTSADRRSCIAFTNPSTEWAVGFNTSDNKFRIAQGGDLGTDATTALFIDKTTYNVGIRVSNPQANLHVANSSSANASGQTVLQINASHNNTAIGSGAKIIFADTDNTHAASIRSYTFGSANTGLAFNTGYSGLSSDKMYIDGNGNVGIGTVPSVALHVKRPGGNSTNLRLESANNNTSSIWLDSAGSNWFIAHQNNFHNGNLLINYGGNTATSALEISKTSQFGFKSVTSPSAIIHIGAGKATAGSAPLKLTAGTNLTTPENGAFEFDGTNLYFTVGGVRKTVTLV